MLSPKERRWQQRRRQHLIDSVAMELEYFAKYPLNRYCVDVAIEPVASYAMQWLDHCSIGGSIGSSPLSLVRRRFSYFHLFPPNDVLEVVAVAVAWDASTDVPMNWVCCRSNRNAMNSLWCRLMFHSMNWNVQQIDLFVRNCNRLAVALDVLGLFVQAAVAGVVAVVVQIKCPRKYQMCRRRNAVSGLIAAGIGRAIVIVVVMKTMTKDQMMKLNSKNSIKKE